MISRRLELDYVSPPRRSRVVGFVVLAVALVIAGLLIDLYREVKSELQAIESRQGLSTEKRPARTLTRTQLDEEIKNVEAVLRQLALPWSRIIETVEDAVTPDVAILQMHPDVQQRSLRLGAEARTQEAMLQYLRQLAASKTLTEIHVVSHQVQSEDSQRPIQFTVQGLIKGMP